MNDPYDYPVWDKCQADLLLFMGYRYVGGGCELWERPDGCDVWAEVRFDGERPRWRYRYVDDEGYLRIRSSLRWSTLARWIEANPPPDLPPDRGEVHDYDDGFDYSDYYGDDHDEDEDRPPVI